MGQEPVDSCVKPQASKLGCETGGALRLIHDTGALLCDIPYSILRYPRPREAGQGPDKGRARPDIIIGCLPGSACLQPWRSRVCECLESATCGLCPSFSR